MASGDARFTMVAVAGAAVVGLAVAMMPVQASVLLAMLVAFTAVVMRPTWAMPLMLVALLVSGAPFWVGHTPMVVVPVTVAKMAAVVVLAAWLARTAFAERVRIPPTPLAWALGCGALTLLGGLAWSVEPGLGLDLALGFSLLAALSLVLNQLVVLSQLRRSLTAMAWLYVAVLALSLGADWLWPTGASRFTGFSLNPNEWSLMVIVPLCPCVAIFRQERGVASGVGLTLALGLAALSVVATESRAGLVALAACAPVVLWVLGRRRALVTAVCALLAGAVFISLADLSSLTERLAALLDSGALELDGSVRDRAIAQQVAWQAFLESPWIGMGAGAFDDRSLVLSGGQVAIGTHNTYLQVLAELGMVGATAMAAIPLAVFGSIAATLRRRPPPPIRAIAIGLLGSAVSVGVLMFSATLLTQAVPFFCLALLMVVQRASVQPIADLERWDLA